MVKIKLFPQFSADYLLYPVMSRLIFILRNLIEFTYDMIYLFLFYLFILYHHCYYYCCCFYYYLLLESFSRQFLLIVFHWSLSDGKSPQVSRNLLSILTVLNNVVVWMVSTRPPTSKSSSPFNNPWVTVPKALITIGKIVTFMFHNFFNSLARSRYLSFFSLSFSFILWSAGTAKSTIFQVLFFFNFFFFIDDYKVWSSGQDWGIRLYAKVPSVFMCVFL